MPFDQIRNQISMMGLAKPDAFNPYAAGDKTYGITGRPNATSGPVSFEGQKGYADRDRMQNARKAAMLQKLQAAQSGNYMSANYLRGMK